VRSIRQIHQIKRRFIKLDDEKSNFQASELYELFLKCETESGEGRDLLKHMAGRARSHLKKTERRLINLRNVTSAQEEYVRDKFGIDIDEFRNSPADVVKD
jgi:hypothetical protein